MAKHTGKNLVVEFIDALGTITFAAEFRQFDIKYTTDMVDTATGSDSDKSYLPTLADATMTFKGLNNGTADPFGTADLARMLPQKSGTILYGPLGNTTGLPKGGAFVFVKSQDTTRPYAGVVETTLEFQRSGPWLFNENIDTW